MLDINSSYVSQITASGVNSASSQVSADMDHLASGLRINSSADDSAGYAIAEGMTSQVNGTNQSLQNINDGVSVVQTAAGAMNSMMASLQKIRSLVVEAGNGTNSAADLESIQSQIDQQVAAVNQVSAQTQFNGISLFASDRTVQVQAGANDGDTINVVLSKTDAGTLGISGMNVVPSSTPVAAPKPYATFLSQDMGPGAVVTIGENAYYATGSGAFVGTTSSTPPIRDLEDMEAAISSAIAVGTSVNLAAPFDATNVNVNASGDLVMNQGTHFFYGSSTGLTLSNRAVGASPLSDFRLLGLLPTGAVVSGPGDAGEISFTKNSHGAFVDQSSGQSYSSAALLQYIDDNDPYTSMSATLSGNTYLLGTYSEAGAGNVVTSQYANVYVTPSGAFTSSPELTSAAPTASDITSLMKPGDQWNNGSSVWQKNSAGGFFNTTDPSDVITSATMIGMLQTGGQTATVSGVQLSMVNGESTFGILPTGVAPPVLYMTPSGGVALTPEAPTSGAPGSSPPPLTVDPIAVVDRAIRQLATQQARNGAAQAQLTEAASLGNITSVNTSQARSRLQDANYAELSSDLTRNEIVEQAGGEAAMQSDFVQKNLLALLQESTGQGTGNRG